MPQDPQVNDVWVAQALTEQVTLPSGQTVIAQRIGMEEILSVGSGDQVDTLTSYVLKNHIDRVRGPQDHKPKKSEQDDGQPSEAELERIITENPELINSTMMMFDRLLPTIVVKPPVRLHFVEGEEGKTELIPADKREPGAVYTDRVGLEDKVYLFQWAVGSLPNPDFRQKSRSPVDSVEDGNQIQLPAVNDSGPQNRTARRRNRRR